MDHPKDRPRWRDAPARRELFALYAEADALTGAMACACSPAAPSGAGVDVPGEPALPLEERVRCCHFGVTGREPYPTTVEMAEVEHAMRERPKGGRGGRRLPMATSARPCPLLDAHGRCRVYASRPFGCRTYFCATASGVTPDRGAIQELSRRIADLSARAFPRDPRPRALTSALARPLKMV